MLNQIKSNHLRIYGLRKENEICLQLHNQNFLALVTYNTLDTSETS